MVSLIQSNFNEFGSGIVAPGTGFALHNRGALFTLDADSPNLLAGRKRPLHTIIPAFAQKGDTRVAFGIMGGWNQSQAHAPIRRQHGRLQDEYSSCPRSGALFEAYIRWLRRADGKPLFAKNARRTRGQGAQDRTHGRLLVRYGRRASGPARRRKGRSTTALPTRERTVPPCRSYQSNKILFNTQAGTPSIRYVGGSTAKKFH